MQIQPSAPRSISGACRGSVLPREAGHGRTVFQIAQIWKQFQSTLCQNSKKALPLLLCLSIILNSLPRTCISPTCGQDVSKKDNMHRQLSQGIEKVGIMHWFFAEDVCLLRSYICGVSFFSVACFKSGPDCDSGNVLFWLSLCFAFTCVCMKFDMMWSDVMWCGLDRSVSVSPHADVYLYMHMLCNVDANVNATRCNAIQRNVTQCNVIYVIFAKM